MQLYPSRQVIVDGTSKKIYDRIRVKHAVSSKKIKQARHVQSRIR